MLYIRKKTMIVLRVGFYCFPLQEELYIIDYGWKENILYED